MKLIIALFPLSVLVAHSFEYEFAKNCNSTNNYLQKQVVNFKNGNPTFFGQYEDCDTSTLISKANKDNIKKISDLTDSTSLCIYESMKANKLRARLSKKGNNIGTRYAVCPGKSSEARLNAKRKIKNSAGKVYQSPCLTKELHETIYKTFLTVSDCVGIDKGVYFSMVNHESKFIPNIGNSLGVYGIAQLSSIAAKQVNINHRINRTKGNKDFTFLEKDYEKRLGYKVSEKENACSRIRGTLKTPFPYRSLTACERSAFPKNPLRSMLYGALLHKYYARLAEKYYKELFTDDVKKKVSKYHVVKTITKYIYNGGPGGVKQILRNYFVTKNAREDGTKVKFADKRTGKKFTSVMKGGFSSFSSEIFKNELADYIRYTGKFPDVYGGSKKLPAATREKRKRNKQRELGGYVSKIDSDRKKIEEKLAAKGLKVKCGI